jgi:hypothetical protein
VWTGEAEIFKICGFQSFEDESENLVGENGVMGSCEEKLTDRVVPTAEPVDDKSPNHSSKGS